MVGGLRSKHVREVVCEHTGRREGRLVVHGRRCGASWLGTDLLSSALILVFRGCVAGSPCIRRWGSWRAGLSAWPRGGELRKGVVGNNGWWRPNGVPAMVACVVSDQISLVAHRCGMTFRATRNIMVPRPCTCL